MTHSQTPDVYHPATIGIVNPTSLGLFLDVGGEDAYEGADRNGTTWGDAPGSDNARVRNMGSGADVAAGAIDWGR